MSQSQAIQKNGNAPVQQQQQRAQQDPAPAPDDRLRAYLSRPAVVERLKTVASKYMQPEELIRLTLLAASRNPEIALCTPESVLRCLMDASALGIRPGGTLGRGWLIPRKNKKVRPEVLELTLDPGWRGLADIARRSGIVRRIEAHPVFERDFFDYVAGTEPSIKHTPYIGAEDRGPVVAAYAVAFFAEGGTQAEVVPRCDLDRIRAMGAEKGPWSDWPEEMARKSAVRRLCKYLPFDEELEKALELATRADAVDAPVPQLAAPEKPRAAQLAEKIRAQRPKADPEPEAAREPEREEPPPDDEPHDAEPPPDVELGVGE